MPKFLIVRNIPGVESMSEDEIKSVARKSNNVLADLGSDIQWMHSYVVNGKTYCLYVAPDEDLIKEHARLTGIPCNHIIEVCRTIGPGLG